LKKGFALVYKKKTDPGLFDSDLEAEKSNLLISRSAQLKKHDDVEINFFDNKKDARITK
jgi:hypothetical protein